MKKIILSLCIVLFFGCSSEESEQQNYFFKNGTDYEVVVKPFKNLLEGAPDFEFTIPKRESKTFKSSYSYSVFDVSSKETDKPFDYSFEGDIRVISLLIPAVKYKITGTASSADITFANSSGGTNQRTVNLPYEIEYSYFSNNFKYISAQSKSVSGSIRVELYIKDKLVSTGYCDNKYCIATAHN